MKAEEDQLKYRKGDGGKLTKKLDGTDSNKSSWVVFTQKKHAKKAKEMVEGYVVR